MASDDNIWLLIIILMDLMTMTKMEVKITMMKSKPGLRQGGDNSCRDSKHESKGEQHGAQASFHPG